MMTFWLVGPKAANSTIATYLIFSDTVKPEQTEWPQVKEAIITDSLE